MAGINTLAIEKFVVFIKISYAYFKTYLKNLSG